MKILLMVVGALLCLTGIVWICQGIGLLPGSFMTGQTKWAIYGAIAFAVGVALLWRSRQAASR